MIDLTPLDVRKKKGDFRRGLRGYEAPQVDDFLDLVADRLEAVVRENQALSERVARLEQQVNENRDREKALTDALVTAQAMRDEIRVQSEREGELLRRHAEQDAARMRAEAAQWREQEENALRALRARQLQFLAGYRAFLEQELAELVAASRALEMGLNASAGLATPAPVVAGGPAVATPAAPPASAAPISETAAPSPSDPAASSRTAPQAARGSAAEAHVESSLAEWEPELEEDASRPAEDAADLILSDDDVVASDEEEFLVDSLFTEAEPRANGSPSSHDEPTRAETTRQPARGAVEAEIGAAFGDHGPAADERIDLDEFDAFKELAQGQVRDEPSEFKGSFGLTLHPAFGSQKPDTAEGRAQPDAGQQAGEESRARISSLFQDEG